MILQFKKPGKIVALASNYKGSTGTYQNMKEPIVFLKGINTIAYDGDKINIPFSLRCWGEAELGFIIKKQACKISIMDAKDYILGYTIVNDVTADNIDGRDHHLARSKSADGFCPVLKEIDTTFEPKDQIIKAHHNDTLVREGKLSDMIWGPAEIVASLSQWMTLNEGDLILTGTPPRVTDKTFLKSGDVFECFIDGLGSINNEFI